MPNYRRGSKRTRLKRVVKQTGRGSKRRKVAEESEPGPSSALEPTLKPPEPPSALEPVPVSDPSSSLEPALVSKPPSELELTIKSEPSSELERAPESEPPSELELTIKSEPSSELERAPESEPPSELEVTTKSEPCSEPEQTIKSEPSSDLESAPGSEPPSEIESAPESEPSSDLESAPESEPPSEIESAPESELSSEPEPAPVLESSSELESAPESELSSEPEPAPVLESSSELESAPESEPSSELELAPVLEPPSELESSSMSELSSGSETTFNERIPRRRVEEMIDDFPAPRPYWWLEGAENPVTLPVFEPSSEPRTPSNSETPRRRSKRKARKVLYRRESSSESDTDLELEKASVLELCSALQGDSSKKSSKRRVKRVKENHSSSVSDPAQEPGPSSEPQTRRRANYVVQDYSRPGPSSAPDPVFVSDPAPVPEPYSERGAVTIGKIFRTAIRKLGERRGEAPPSAETEEDNTGPSPEELLRENFRLDVNERLHAFLEGLRSGIEDGMRLIGEIGIEYQAFLENRNQILALKDDIQKLKEKLGVLRNNAEKYAEGENWESMSDEELVNFDRKSEEENKMREIDEEFDSFQERIFKIVESFTKREREIEIMKKEADRGNYNKENVCHEDMPNTVAFRILQRMREDFRSTKEALLQLYRDQEQFEENNKSIWDDLREVTAEMKSIESLINSTVEESHDEVEESRTSPEREERERVDEATARRNFKRSVKFFRKAVRTISLLFILFSD